MVAMPYMEEATKKILSDKISDPHLFGSALFALDTEWKICITKGKLLQCKEKRNDSSRMSNQRKSMHQHGNGTPHAANSIHSGELNAFSNSSAIARYMKSCWYIISCCHLYYYLFLAIILDRLFENCSPVLCIYLIDFNQRSVYQNKWLSYITFAM